MKWTLKLHKPFLVDRRSRISLIRTLETGAVEILVEQVEQVEGEGGLPKTPQERILKESGESIAEPTDRAPGQ